MDHAKSRSSRSLEADIRQSVPGDLPTERLSPLRNARTTLVVAMETCEADLVRRAIAWFRSVGGDSEIEDGAVLAALARKVLAEAEGADAPTGEAAFRITIQHCPGCGGSAADDAEVSEAIATQAVASGEVVDLRPGPIQGHCGSRSVQRLGGWFTSATATAAWSQAVAAIYGSTFITSGMREMAAPANPGIW